jgi:hypothetical protein
MVAAALVPETLRVFARLPALLFLCRTDLGAAAMKGRMEGECRRIGGSPRTGAYRRAYIS